MSSDEYHNKVQSHLQLSPKKPNCHQQLSIHHEPSSASSSTVSSIASASTQTEIHDVKKKHVFQESYNNCCEIAGNGGTIKRRKSTSLSTASPAYSIHHSLQNHDDTCENIHDDDDSAIVVVNGPIKPNSNSINSNFNYNVQNGSGNNIITNDGVYLHMASGGSSRLSIHHPASSYDAEIMAIRR